MSTQPSRKRPQSASTPFDDKIQTFLYRLAKVRNIDRSDVDTLQQTFKGIETQMNSLRQQLYGSNTRIAQLQAEVTQSRNQDSSLITELRTQLMSACEIAINLYHNQVNRANEQIYKKIVSAFIAEISTMSNIKTMVKDGYVNPSVRELTELVREVLSATMRYDVLSIMKHQYQNVFNTKDLLMRILNKLQNLVPSQPVAKLVQNMHAVEELYIKDTDSVVSDLAKAVGLRFDAFLSHVKQQVQQTHSLDIIAFLNLTLEARLLPVNRIQEMEEPQSSEAFIYSLEEGYFYALLFRYVATQGDPIVNQRLHSLSDIVWHFIFDGSGAIYSRDLNTSQTHLTQGLQTVWNYKESGLQSFMNALGNTLCDPLFTQAQTKVSVQFIALRNPDNTPITEDQVLNQWIDLIKQLQQAFAKTDQSITSESTTTLGDVCSLIKCVLRPEYIKNTEIADEHTISRLQHNLAETEKNTLTLRSQLPNQEGSSNELESQLAVEQQLRQRVLFLQNLTKQCHLSNWNILRQIALDVSEGEVVNDLTTFRAKLNDVIKIFRQSIQNAVTVYKFIIRPTDLASLPEDQKNGWQEVIRKMNEYQDWSKARLELSNTETVKNESIKPFFLKTLGTLLKIDLVTENLGIPSLDPSSAELSLQYIVQLSLKVARKVELTISATGDITDYTLPDIGADDLEDLEQDVGAGVPAAHASVLGTSNTLKQIMAAELATISDQATR